MPHCIADATWYGSIEHGEGDVALGSGVWTGRYDTPEASDASNPEELLAAGHASCFSMTATFVLSESGYDPESISTEAAVTLAQGREGFSIPSIDLTVSGDVPDATEEEFAAIISEVEDACPVSKALGSPDVDVTSRLE